jgi:hypothetical protein
MPEFNVVLREIHTQPYKVTADSLGEAQDKVLEGEGEMYIDDVVRILENTSMDNKQKARAILELRYIDTDELNPFDQDSEEESEE